MAEAVRKLTEQGKLISNAVEEALVKSSVFIQEEVKESIAGRRTEEKSVDTGNLINSVEIDKIGTEEFKVYTDVEYAAYLEFGTIFIQPRSHFENTAERTRDKVQEEIKQAVDKVVK